jgi:hypothetical protein
MAQHRYSLLGLRNDDSADFAHSGEPICCMVGAKPETQVVALGGRHNRVGEGRNLCLFIPTMISLMGSERSDLEIKANLSQWLVFNYGRHVLTFLGWLLALKALSLPSERRD